MEKTQKYSSKELFDWLIDKAKSTNGVRNRLLGATQQQKGSTVMGKMYLFTYDAKHKDKLPIWDKYPLVFPIERYNDGFLGLNVHYLGLREREALLGQLTKYASSRSMTERSRIMMTYDLLSGTKRLNSLARPCIKRYLFSQVRSKFVEIPATEWDRVVQLPIALWVKQG